ncbi:hypothetical protein [Pseudactinotalea sp. Z1748]
MEKIIITGILIVVGVIAAVFLGDQIVSMIEGLVSRIDLGGY